VSDYSKKRALLDHGDRAKSLLRPQLYLQLKSQPVLITYVNKL